MAATHAKAETVEVETLEVETLEVETLEVETLEVETLEVETLEVDTHEVGTAEIVAEGSAAVAGASNPVRGILVGVALSIPLWAGLIAALRLALRALD